MTKKETAAAALALGSLAKGASILIAGPWEEVPPPVGAPGPLYQRRNAWRRDQEGKIVQYAAAIVPIKTQQGDSFVAQLGGVPLSLPAMPLAAARKHLDDVLKAGDWDLA